MKVSGRKRPVLPAVLLLLTAAAVVLLTLVRSGKEASYRKAAELMAAGDPEEAYKAFRKLEGYKDSGEKLEELVRENPALPYRTAAKGDRVTFGTYEQGNDLSDGAEAVEWIVIDRIEDEILLLSADCLDCRTYNDVPFESVTWETSAIREWLNKDFYESVFTEEEKKLVMAAEIQNSDHSTLGTEGGAATTDLVFLLSETEAGIYMGTEADREYIGRAPASAYALARGAQTDEEGMAEWWLRSPGTYECTAQFTETSGSVYSSGAYVDLAYAVRPALWLRTGE